MSYIDNNLMNGERVLYRSKLHWIVFGWPTVSLIVAIVFFAIQLVGLGILFMALAIFSGVSPLIAFFSSEFGVTNKRVIVKVGLIRRNSLEVLLNKVEGIQVSQGLLGRILNFGSITVSGTGGTKDPFHKIDSPFEFRRQVQEQIALVQDSK